MYAILLTVSQGNWPLHVSPQGNNNKYLFKNHCEIQYKIESHCTHCTSQINECAVCSFTKHRNKHRNKVNIVLARIDCCSLLKNISEKWRLVHFPFPSDGKTLPSRVHLLPSRDISANKSQMQWMKSVGGIFTWNGRFPCGTVSKSFFLKSVHFYSSYSGHWRTDIFFYCWLRLFRP